MWPISIKHSARRFGTKPARCTLALLAGTLFVSGCTHVLVHDERRDKQGQDARKLVAEAHVGDTVAALEKVFNDVAALEEFRARDRAAYLFDLELRVVSRAPALGSRFAEGVAGQTDGLQTVVESRLKKLALSDPSLNNLEALRRSAATIKARRATAEVDLNEFYGTSGHRFEDCAAVYAAAEDPTGKTDMRERISPVLLKKLPVAKRVTAREGFPNLVDKCSRVDSALAEHGKLFDGTAINKARSDILGIQTDLQQHAIDMNIARGQLDVAARELQTASEQAKSGDGGKLEALQKRAIKVAELVKQLSQGSQALGAGSAHAMAAEKLERLEAVLGAVAGASGEGKVELTEDEKVSVAVIRGIPALADEADKLLIDARKPRLVPLVAAVDQQKLVLKGFEARQAAKHKQLEARQRRLEAMLDEAEALANVLRPLKENGAWESRSIEQLLGEPSGQSKVNFLRALSIYADDVKRFRMEADVWDRRALAAMHEEGLSQSKYVAAQWDALSDTIATVLSDYHAAGIRQADLAEFFKALGLVAIGAGVTK